MALTEEIQKEISMTAKLRTDIVSKLYSLIPKIVIAVIIFLIGYFIIKLITKFIAHFFEKTDFEKSIETFIQNAVKVVLWAILLVIILGNLGVNVSGLIAGLGIMGFIVGFALKDTLGNLAAGVFLLFHKPFKVGDWINAGGIVGGVQKMGVAACVLNSPDNTKIVIPNSKLWGDVIQNYSANKTRKLYNINIQISYSDDIGKAIKIINNILKKDKRVMPEPQVVVKELGDNGITIAVRPKVERKDYWNLYFDLNRKIKEAFDKNKITIPFPQRDVWIKKKK